MAPQTQPEDRTPPVGEVKPPTVEQWLAMAAVIIFGISIYRGDNAVALIGAGIAYLSLDQSRKSQETPFKLEYFKRQYDGFKEFVVEAETVMKQAFDTVEAGKVKETNLKHLASDLKRSGYKAWEHYMKEPFIVNTIRNELLAFQDAVFSLANYLEEIAEKGEEGAAMWQAMKDNETEVEYRLNHIDSTVENLTNTCYDTLKIDGLSLGTRNLLTEFRQLPR